jgi:iron complex transport system substrate-binding protein
MVNFGIDNNNPMIDNLQKSGLKVLILDWWSKLRWEKLNGSLMVLCLKRKRGQTIFDGIVKNYNDAKQLVSQNQQQPFCRYQAVV